MGQSSSSVSTSPPTTTSGPLLESWLRRDADSPSLMIRFLEVRDMVRLHSTCQAWRAYMRASTHPLTTSKHDLTISTVTQLDQVSGARWLRPHLANLNLRCVSDLNESEYPRILAVLPLFRPLLHLQIHLPLAKIESSFFDLIAASMPQLQELNIKLQNFGSTREKATWKRLRSLSLAPLRRLTHLTSFQLMRGFIATKEQMDDLVQCSSLQSLRFACWYPAEGNEFPEYEDRTMYQWMDDTLGRLHLLPNLQEFEFVDQRMELEAWRRLTNCRSLTRLKCEECSDLGDEWRLLEDFSQLKTFSFAPLFVWGAPMPRVSPPALMAALQRSISITDLTLRFVTLSDANLTQILDSLSSLDHLWVEAANLESASAFAVSRSLTRLELIRCDDFNRNGINWIESLPAMPSVTSVRINQNYMNQWPSPPVIPALVQTMPFFKELRKNFAARIPQARDTAISITARQHGTIFHL